MFAQEKEVRVMATEVLIQTIEQNRLPIETIGEKIGFLISHAFGPMARMMEVLENCKDISYKHNDALLQLLSISLMNTNIKEKIPTNFKKILELFYDLQKKLKKEITNETRSAVEKLNEFKSLQPLIKKILN